MVCTCGAASVFYGSVDFFTGEWCYVMWSFMVSMIAGFPSMINTWRAQKKANNNKIEQVHKNS